MAAEERTATLADASDPDALKAAVDAGALIDLCDELGVRRNGASLYCPHPDHDDHNASAGVFLATMLRPQHGRWKCQGCGEGGDAIELVRVVKGLSFADARAWLAQWIDRQPATTPSSSTGKGSFDPDDVREAWQKRDDALDLTRDLLRDKGIAAPASWAVRRWRFGAVRKYGRLCLVMPYLRAHAGGDDRGRRVKIVHAKRRFPTPVAFDGTVWQHDWEKLWCDGGRPKSGLLFGEHLDRGQSRVLICEGETDVIAVAWWLSRRTVREHLFGDSDPVLVLGWPDANEKPTRRLVRLLTGRRVLLLPDRDDKEGQGMACAARWSQALAQEPATEVAIALFPPGRDACSAGRRAVLGGLGAATR